MLCRLIYYYYYYHIVIGSVNAILVILFVINGGYNHYDITTNSKYHTHLINSQNETYFSAPAEVVVDTDEQGTGINLDYLSIVKPDSNPLNQIFKISSSRHIINTNINNINHPEGNLRFSNNQSFFLDFYECHTLGCKPPEEIIDVYMTSSKISDKQIEYLFQEYEKKNNHQLKEQQQVCCDENTPCVPIEDDNSNNEKASITTTESLDPGNKQQLQQQEQKQQDYSLKGENRHSKKIKEGEVDNENLISNLKTKIKDELEKSNKEQQILLIENKQNIIDFLLDNTDSIRVEDLKIYEPIYKCYRKKGNCQICNSLSNIICKICNNYNKENWLCTNHWKQHAIENHDQQ